MNFGLLLLFVHACNLERKVHKDMLDFELNSSYMPSVKDEIISWIQILAVMGLCIFLGFIFGWILPSKLFQ